MMIEEQIIKLLRENSIGKQTAVIESMDLGIYIWRKNSSNKKLHGY